MTLLHFCYILNFQSFTSLIGVVSSSSRSISAVKNAHFATCQPHKGAIIEQNSVLATCTFLVTFVTFYFLKIEEYNNSKHFRQITAGNKLFKVPYFVTFCYIGVIFCYIGLLHVVTSVIN